VPNYHHVARGQLNSAYNWTVGMYSVSSLAEAAAETAFHAAFKAMWNNAGFKALFPATNHWLSSTTYTMSGTWHSTTSTTTNEDIPGTGTQALPYECALLITFRTAIKNRTGIGRWYLPAATTASLTVNGWTYLPASMTAFAAGVTAMNTSWAGSLTPVILHRKTLTTDNILHADLPDQVYVQRRRAHKRVPTRTTAY
jgi:hypothetical protein